MYKSAIGNAKGIKAQHDATHHWWHQRITAIALIPLVLWFTTNALLILNGDLIFNHFLVLSSKISVMFFTLLLLIALYHSTLGVQVIIEDYISSKTCQTSLIIFLKLFGAFTAFLLFFSLLIIFFKVV